MVLFLEGGNVISRGCVFRGTLSLEHKKTPIKIKVRKSRRNLSKNLHIFSSTFHLQITGKRLNRWDSTAFHFPDFACSSPKKDVTRFLTTLKNTRHAVKTLKSCNSQGQNAFHLAAGRNDSRLLHVLSQHCPVGEMVNVKDKKGFTPLEFAVSKGSKKVVHLLVNFGAILEPSVLKLAVLSADTNHPLFRYFSRVDACKLAFDQNVTLGEKFLKKMKRNEVQHMLGWAVNSKRLQVCKLCVKHGANLRQPVLADRLALSWAIYQDFDEFIDEFGSFGADLWRESDDKECGNALIAAVHCRKHDVLRKCLSFGVPVLTASRSALMESFFVRDREITKILLLHGVAARDIFIKPEFIPDDLKPLAKAIGSMFDEKHLIQVKNSPENHESPTLSTADEALCEHKERCLVPFPLKMCAVNTVRRILLNNCSSTNIYCQVWRLFLPPLIKRDLLLQMFSVDEFPSLAELMSTN